jgi:hypothetical protein
MADSKLHRIDLEDLLGDDYAGEWVDVHASRSWGAKLKVQDAATQGIGAYKLALFVNSIARWSRAEPPEQSAYEALPEEIGEAVYEAIGEWYDAQKRSVEGHKRPLAAVVSEAGEGASGTGIRSVS